MVNNCIKEVFLDLLKAISNPNFHKLEKVLHPQTIFEFPYGLSGMPKAITGRSEVISYLMNRKFKCTFYTPVYLELTESGMIICEVLSEETFSLTGKTYQQHIICKVKVTEGLIESYKEFFNPITRLEGLLNLDIDNLDFLGDNN